MNRDLYPVALAQAMPLEMADDLLVEQCMSGGIAIETTCVLSGYSKDALAEKISKAREVLSRACSGRGGLDIDVLINLMRESGTVFIAQYIAKQLGGEFRFLSQDEIELRNAEKLVAQIKARRAA